MQNKPALAKGTRDFGPSVMIRRKHIFQTIETVFKQYGFQPLETPAMEQLSTLSGKYGEEGDKLLFKILNSGNFLEGTDRDDLINGSVGQLAARFCEKGLRYDLTVPLARYVSMNRQTLNFPFKRYQMQPVWRADRPQKGRYREFWQCDADILGSESLLNEADLLLMASDVFSSLGLKVRVELNHRKLLESITQHFGIGSRFNAFVVLIDKLDKTDFASLHADFLALGITEIQIEALRQMLVSLPFNRNSLDQLAKMLPDSPESRTGCSELESLLKFLETAGCEIPVQLNFSLARGLDYYTGCIIEIKSEQVAMGSISGGGRYDNLTGIFGFPGVSGVGISFGVDRIYDVMDSLNLFDSLKPGTSDILLCHPDEEGMLYNYALARLIRREGFACEVYPSVKKMAKQFEYADKKGIPLVLVNGAEEAGTDTLSYKNLKTREQGRISRNELSKWLHQLPDGSGA